MMLIRQIPGQIVIGLLEDLMTDITEHLALHQDSNIPGGSFEWHGFQNLAFQILNANNHQVTWGVLGAAVTGLRDYFLSSPSAPGRLSEGNPVGYAVYFSVKDGENVVGMGSLG